MMRFLLALMIFGNSWSHAQVLRDRPINVRPVQPPIIHPPRPPDRVRPSPINPPNLRPIQPPRVTPVGPPARREPAPIRPSPRNDVIVTPRDPVIVRPPFNIGRPDWDGRDGRGQRLPPVVRLPGSSRDIAQPVTRVRVRPGQPAPQRHIRSLNPALVNGRRIVVDLSRGVVMPEANVRVHISRPQVVPMAPPVATHLHRHLYPSSYVGSHWVWIYGHRVELHYYWWGGYYWLWHDGHFDWWYPSAHYFWCDSYSVYLEWGYPTFFLTHMRINYSAVPERNSFVSHRVVGDLLLKRGNDLLYKHGDHYDLGLDEPSADELNFYCSDHHTYYELRLSRAAGARGLADELLINGRLYTRVPEYDLYWDLTEGVYVSILTIAQ